MNTIHFIFSDLHTLLTLTYQHLELVIISLAVAIITAIPIGIVITFNENIARKVLNIVGIIMTIPSIAMFGMMIPILSLVNQGIGFVPAVCALILYAQLPIVRNTYTAIKNVDPNTVEAALGMGMTRSQILWEIQLPLSLSLIMGGVRTAVVMNIGIAAIAAYIGAGGIGIYITRGISTTYDEMVLAGAIAVSVLAIFADFVLGFLEKALTPRGLK